MVEELTAVFAAHLHVHWQIAHQLDNLSHMVIVFREKLALALRIKEIIGCKQLEDLEGVIRLLCRRDDR